MSNTSRQLTCSLSALHSGDCSEVAFVDWWDNFSEPVVSPATIHLFTTPASLTESSNLICNEGPECEKACQPHKLLPCWSFLREANSRPDQPSVVPKAPLGALLISSLPSRLLPLMGYFAWHIFSHSGSSSSLQYELSDTPNPSSPTLINSFVLPSAHLLPQTNCRQKYFG